MAPSVDAFASVWRRTLDFKGRAARAEYAWWQLFLVMSGFAVGLASGENWWIALGVFLLVVFLPTLSLTIRRLHDLNLSGWWLVAFIAAIALLKNLAVGQMADWVSNPKSTSASAAAGLTSILYFAIQFGGPLLLLFPRGTNGPNRFGTDPAAPAGRAESTEKAAELDTTGAAQTGRAMSGATPDAPTTTPSQHQSEEAIYAQAGREILAGEVDAAAYARALENASTDTEVKSAYIRLRVASLRRSATLSDRSHEISPNRQISADGSERRPDESHLASSSTRGPNRESDSTNHVRDAKNIPAANGHRVAPSDGKVWISAAVLVALFGVWLWDPLEAPSRTAATDIGTTQVPLPPPTNNNAPTRASGSSGKLRPMPKWEPAPGYCSESSNNLLFGRDPPNPLYTPPEKYWEGRNRDEIIRKIVADSGKCPGNISEACHTYMSKIRDPKLENVCRPFWVRNWIGKLVAVD